MTSALFAFLHFITAFGVVFGIFYEWLTFHKNISIKEVKMLQKADLIYGISTVLVLIIGFARVFYFEKGKDFYFQNPFFHIKLGVFILIGLFSIYPSLKFMKWKKQTRYGQAPAISHIEFTRIRLFLRLEVSGIVILILAASLMAKGVGL
jgi:putative membrane protein